jgi:hypothetical protein
LHSTPNYTNKRKKQPGLDIVVRICAVAFIYVSNLPYGTLSTDNSTGTRSCHDLSSLQTIKTLHDQSILNDNLQIN